MSTTGTDTSGAKVEEYRERLGMLQKELAELVGLSRSHLNRIEKGARKRPHLAAFLRMVSALRLTRSEAEDLTQRAGLSPGVLKNMNFEQEVHVPTPAQLRHGRALKSGPQASSTPMPTIANPALALPESLFDGTFEQIQSIFESKLYSEEQLIRAAAELLESAKQIARLIEPQSGIERKVRR